MKVIKLGGSLMSDMQTLTACLNTIKHYEQDHIVIVPGGGMFADQVRKSQQQWGFDDKTAHHMALLAMQQMALLLASISKSFKVAETVVSIQQAWLQTSVVIWSPCIKQLDAAGIQANWEVSSDSLAAWLAGQLKVSALVLVKSADIASAMDIQSMQKQGVLDQAFADFVDNASFKVTVINKYDFNRHLF